MDYTKLTALRLKLAMEAVGFNQTSLADAWREYNYCNNLSDGHGLPVTRKTVGEWLEKGIPTQSPKRGLDDPLQYVAEFFRIAKETFIEESPDWSEVSFQAAIRASWHHEERRHIEKEKMAALSEITSMIDTKNLERVFRDYEGYYFAYGNWVEWNDGEEISVLIPTIYKTLLKVDKIDYEHNLIKTKYTTSRFLQARRDENISDIWGFEGILIPLPNTLNFIFESTHWSLEDSTFIFIITRRKPKKRLIGLLTAETTSPQSAGFHASIESFPASTRIFLNRINEEEVERGEDFLVNQLGFFQSEELLEIEKGFLKEFHNELKYGLLTIH